MSRTTVKIEIPASSPEELIGLADKILKHHLDLGDKSPLKGGLVDMDKLQANVKSASDDRTEAKSLHNKAESLNQQANLTLGIDKTQNSKTQNTVYSLLGSIRNILEGANKGSEEKLSEWGFNVVLGSVSTKASTKAKKKVE